VARPAQDAGAPHGQLGGLTAAELAVAPNSKLKQKHTSTFVLSAPPERWHDGHFQRLGNGVHGQTASVGIPRCGAGVMSSGINRHVTLRELHRSLNPDPRGFYSFLKRRVSVLDPFGPKRP
jgi:hypothetical protein